MALRNKDLFTLYTENNTIQKEFKQLESTPFNSTQLDSYYSNYNKTGIETRIKLPHTSKSRQGGSLLVTRTAEDVLRLTKFIISKDGRQFISNQLGLQLMNPKTEYLGFSDPNRKYNPLSLLTNAAGIPTIGLHDTRNKVPKDHYLNVVKTNNDDTNNRLIRVYKELKINEFNDSQTPNSSTLSLSNKLPKLSNSKLGKFVNGLLQQNGEPIKLLSGLGGPKSLFGLGFTTIRRYENGESSLLKYFDNNGNERYYPNRTKDNNYLSSLEELSPILDNYNLLYVDNNLQPGELSTSGVRIDKVNLSGLNDFQSITEFENNKYGYNNFEGTEFFENRNDQFKNESVYKSKYNDTENYYENWNYYRRLNIPINKPGATDLINEILDANTLQNYEIISQDFIKLKIGSIQFRCIMTGLTDTFSPETTGTRYIGRPDDVWTYQGVSRSISFNLIVYAFSVKEMKGIYDKLNKLAQYVSPIVNNGLMTGQIINLKIGDWFSTRQPVTSSERNEFKSKESKMQDKYQNNEEVLNRLFPNKSDKTISGFSTLSNRGLPVIMDSLSFTVDDNYSWDILMELPMMVSISLGFKVIDNESPNANKIYFGDGLMTS